MNEEEYGVLAVVLAYMLSGHYQHTADEELSRRYDEHEHNRRIKMLRSNGSTKQQERPESSLDR